uniref:Helix-hairpin-helix domain-containing protein n=1 Tax=candidate division WOR-3 bacterium TaxID=2052148 RepID=A0A7C3Z2T8_UNCW3
MNEKEKTILIFLIVAFGTALILNFLKHYQTSKAIMKILPMEETLGEKSETIKGRPVKEQKKDEKININRATLEELITLPGIGPVLAERIIEYRKQSGGFKRIEEIMKVKGIGRKKFARLKDKIKID